jgi:hypothetical protein
MKPERICGTQSTLFDFAPNGQKLLFNGLPPKRGKSVATQSSLLETITDELHERETVPMLGQNRLF